MSRFYRDEGAGLYRKLRGKCISIILRIAIILEHFWWSVEAGSVKPDTKSLTAFDATIDQVESYFKPIVRITYGLNGTSTSRALAAGLCAEIIQHRPTIINAREVYMSWGIKGLSRAEEACSHFTILEKADWMHLMSCKATKLNERPK